MESRTYKIGRKRVEVKDKYILEVLEKAERLEISPREAENKIRMHLLSNRNLEIGETFQKLNLLEKMTEGFYAPGRGRATPLVEKYAEKHKLSGRVDTLVRRSEPDPEDIYDYNKMNRVNALRRMGIRVECSDADFLDMEKLNTLVARQMEIEKRKGEYRT